MTPCLSLEVSTESLVTTESSATSVLVSDLVKINKKGQTEKIIGNWCLRFTQHIDSCSVSKQSPEHPGDFSEQFPLCPLRLASRNIYPAIIGNLETTLVNKIKYIK